MNNKLEKTLQLIFKNPVQKNIKWKDVISLLIGLGVEIIEGSGSRVTFHYKERVKAVFHKPHPGNELRVGAVIALRVFLRNIGVLL